MQIITFQGDLYFPDPPQDSDGGERTRKCAVRNASMIGHRREDCGTRVRDSCARASLPTLPLPGCWHGVEQGSEIFCCVHCARSGGKTDLKDRV